MRGAALIAIALLTSACFSEGEAKHTTRTGIEVVRLFSVDGCTVYRFSDGGVRYFARCGSSSTTNANESCGKSCTRNVTVTTVGADE